jgi:catalase
MSTKPQAQRQPPDPLSQELLEAFDGLFGHHPGFRPVHAKGILLSGTFTPSARAQSLSNAPHITRASTPVAVRFSDFAGIPNVPDFDEEGASPRGCAIRFYLADHVHTDIVAHSIDAFPAHTAEEFLEFLRAIGASGPGAAHPTPVETFLSTRPAALAFVQAPKPIPTSFAHEHFFSVSAYKFSNANGAAQFGRYQILPEEGTQYLDSATAKAQAPDFLFEELRNRIARKPVRLNIKVQLAAAGDVVDNSTIQWPADRPVVEFGTVELTAILPENDAEQRRIIFDTIPRVQGIEPSGDPLLEPRANLYLHSGRRRRSSI